MVSKVSLSDMMLGDHKATAPVVPVPENVEGGDAQGSQAFDLSSESASSSHIIQTAEAGTGSQGLDVSYDESEAALPETVKGGDATQLLTASEGSQALELSTKSSASSHTIQTIEAVLPENMKLLTPPEGSGDVPFGSEGGDATQALEGSTSSSHAVQTIEKPEVEANESLPVFHEHSITINDEANEDFSIIIGDEAYENPEKLEALGGTVARKFFDVVLKECNRTNIRLLLLAASLTLGFGIMEQGPRKGWFDGAFLFTVTILLVLVASIIKMKNKDNNNPDTNSKLWVDIDNLYYRMQNISLMVSILTLIVLFLQYVAGKVEEGKQDRPEPQNKPTTLENFSNSFEKILHQSTFTSKAKRLLFVSLVGVTEGVPFVISLAIRYQNRLQRSSSTTDPHVVANLTTVCSNKSSSPTEDEKVDNGNLEIFLEQRTDEKAPAPVEVEMETSSLEKARESCDIITTDEVAPTPREAEMETSSLEKARESCDDIIIDEVGPTPREVEIETSSFEKARESCDIFVIDGVDPAPREAEMETSSIEKARESCDIIVTDEVDLAPREAEMETSSIEKAKESCGIIITDGSSEDLIFENIQSFLQLYIITTSSCTSITLIKITTFGDSFLTGIQLTWLNLSMPFLGGLALLTKPVRSVPTGSRSSLITIDMTRNILLQVSYQTICVLILGSGVIDVLGTSNMELQSVVSNSFTLCQIFNLFNARELKRKNFFKGIHQHRHFWVAGVVFIGLQVGFVQASIGCCATLDEKQWLGCILIGTVSWLVDWLGKCTTSDWLGKWTS